MVRARRSPLPPRARALAPRPPRRRAPHIAHRLVARPRSPPLAAHTRSNLEDRAWIIDPSYRRARSATPHLQTLTSLPIPPRFARSAPPPTRSARSVRVRRRRSGAVERFTVGREGVGEVTWHGATDLFAAGAPLDLDAIVDITPGEVAVYHRPEMRASKPPSGFRTQSSRHRHPSRRPPAPRETRSRSDDDSRRPATPRSRRTTNPEASGPSACVTGAGTV